MKVIPLLGCTGKVQILRHSVCDDSNLIFNGPILFPSGHLSLIRHWSPQIRAHCITRRSSQVEVPSVGGRLPILTVTYSTASCLFPRLRVSLRERIPSFFLKNGCHSILNIFTGWWLPFYYQDEEFSDSYTVSSEIFLVDRQNKQNIHDLRVRAITLWFISRLSFMRNFHRAERTK